MSFLGNIEKTIMDTVSKRLMVKTDIVDTKDELKMINITTVDGKEIYRHEFDLEPLVNIIIRRLKNE